jgi:hypothetical protein
LEQINTGTARGCPIVCVASTCLVSITLAALRTNHHAQIFSQLQHSEIGAVVLLLSYH